MKNKNELFGLVGQRLIINQKLVKNINYEKESYKLRCQDRSWLKSVKLQSSQYIYIFHGFGITYRHKT